jgi:hypothetical protein
MKKILPSLLAIALLLSCAKTEAPPPSPRPSPTPSDPFPVAVSFIDASSFVIEDGPSAGRYHPYKAIDGDPLTAWNEGADGPGIGQWLAIRLSQPIKADEIRLMPGYYDPTWYKQNNRMKSMEIKLDGKTIQAEVTDGMEEKSVALDPATSFSTIKLTIKDVYPGTAYDDTCLSEIGFYRKGLKIVLDVSGPRERSAFIDTPADTCLESYSIMGYHGIECFFGDHTYLEVYSEEGLTFADGRTIGKWKLGKNNLITVYAASYCGIQSSGRYIYDPDDRGPRPPEYYEHYEYIVEPRDDFTINWSNRINSPETQISKAGNAYSEYLTKALMDETKKRMEELAANYRETLIKVQAWEKKNHKKWEDRF